MSIHQENLVVPPIQFQKCKAKTTECGCRHVYRGDSVRVRGIAGWWGDSKKYANEKPKKDFGYILTFETIQGTPLRDYHNKLVLTGALKEHSSVLDFARNAFEHALAILEKQLAKEKGASKKLDLAKCLVRREDDNLYRWVVHDDATALTVKSPIEFGSLMDTAPEEEEEEDFFEEQSETQEEEEVKTAKSPRVMAPDVNKNDDSYEQVSQDVIEESIALTRKSKSPGKTAQSPLDNEDPGKFFGFLPKNYKSSKAHSPSHSGSRTPVTPSYGPSASPSESSPQDGKENDDVNELEERDSENEESIEPTQPVAEQRARSRSRSKSPARTTSKSPVRTTSKSPVRTTSKSPVRPESKSPSKQKRERSPSPARSKSPVRTAKSPSLFMEEENPTQEVSETSVTADQSSVPPKKRKGKKQPKGKGKKKVSKKEVTPDPGSPKFVTNLGRKINYDIVDDPDKLAKGPRKPRAKKAKTTTE